MSSKRTSASILPEAWQSNFEYANIPLRTLFFSCRDRDRLPRLDVVCLPGAPRCRILREEADRFPVAHLLRVDDHLQEPGGGLRREGTSPGKSAEAGVLRVPRRRLKRGRDLGAVASAAEGIVSTLT